MSNTETIPDPLEGIKVLAGHHFDETVGREMKFNGVSDVEYDIRRIAYQDEIASSGELTRILMNLTGLGDPEL